MTAEEIIASGLLELYVTGSISQEDQRLVEEAMVQYPSVREEVTVIEASLMRLSEAAAGKVPERVWDRVSEDIAGIKPIKIGGSRRNWSSITGWAAAIVFFAGLAWMLKENNELRSRMRKINTQNVVLREKVGTSEVQLAQANELLEIVRSEAYKAVKLPGNAEVAPEAYATVYYNSEENIAYIDAQGLPKPPRGKVYQVWSLKMNPLTPSSVGLLEAFESSETAFFKVENVPVPEAFGITLEPEGGSESPTLSQLYTLGMVSP